MVGGSIVFIVCPPAEGHPDVQCSVSLPAGAVSRPQEPSKSGSFCSSVHRESPEVSCSDLLGRLVAVPPHFFLSRSQDVKRCLNALEELGTLQVTSHILQKNTDVVATLKKVQLEPRVGSRLGSRHSCPWSVRRRPVDCQGECQSLLEVPRWWEQKGGSRVAGRRGGQLHSLSQASWWADSPL